MLIEGCSEAEAAQDAAALFCTRGGGTGNPFKKNKLIPPRADLGPVSVRTPNPSSPLAL